ncbi:hypothetical protein bpr_II390 (plasmid) [Butyrivibrio proteoclasticus B316]|uniref:Lipoprotein n=1 Tax=Butyrivibrio proteoclasticus (strain ATCC 51982 / DSM 14932 / B316) TaxID=515622 RepID=E0S4J5_BUTPB|nr:hypothetical protein [Butyrivibrio proteoclasticus]ADL36327.1 hypothetical protein bpr_II390 [Butyrivibrio proteoclasticus B316]
MKKKILCICLISAVLLSVFGCGDKESASDIQMENKIPEDLVSECCICNSINADGTLLLWGDRSDGDLFASYTIPSQPDVRIGDEVLLVYSESERAYAKYSDNRASRTFYMQNCHIFIEKITKENIKAAVPGTRKNKFLAQYGIGDGEEKENIDTQVQYSGDLQKQEQEPLQDIEYAKNIDHSVLEVRELIIDTSSVSDTGQIYDVVYERKGQVLSLIINEKQIKLQCDSKVIIGTIPYSITEEMYFGEVSDMPAIGDYLFYLNRADQMCLAEVIGIEYTPGEQCGLKIEELNIAEYITKDIG